MNGVTSQKVIDIRRDEGIPVFEKNNSFYEAYGAEETFLTGTFGAQTSVEDIDGKSTGDMNRPVTKHIRDTCKECIANDVFKMLSDDRSSD